MNIQLLSDLHLEANPAFVPVPAMDADLLVLAGDIGSYQVRRDGSVMDEPDWGLQRFSPLPQYAGWPAPVVFVPGNHEYDALDLDQAHAGLRQVCDRLGIQWLERETLQMQGVRLIGTTLWSDYDVFGEQAPTPTPPRHGRAGAVPPIRPPDPLTHRLQQREKAFRAANHYLVKMAGQRHGRLFDAEAMRTLAQECQAWLRDALAVPFDGPTVVITHFAPTLHSMDPRYGRSPGTAGFCNGLDDLLPLADLWLHGHLHCPTDVQVGRCRIKANPLGYHDKNEQASFEPACCIRVSASEATHGKAPAV
ncbi:metallophosphoesterase [Hydrogenophaga sp. PBL-H3]|uniref:metallophosphoesterase n=1 Tax=Hydrogenophaga sp. PBL-H3 TaxID=434010 RepID=UPI0013202B28|nr:metallophosphoesterase [Hydrogenophaga sp. PBL-H3]QHE74687.1 metallophosphoesterase [Hydrogenophaga sp. PBL-H3]QHE79112.1 metallophosphoesterase [Hydrogenophaga sp. PBL-H3]